MMYANWELDSAPYNGESNPITFVNIKLSWGGNATPQIFNYPVNPPTTQVTNQGWHRYTATGTHTVTMSGYATSIYMYDYIPPFSATTYVN